MKSINQKDLELFREPKLVNHNLLTFGVKSFLGSSFRQSDGARASYEEL